MSEAPETSAPTSAPAARRMGVGLIWAAIYAVIALVFTAAAAYMHVVKATPLMQPQVLFPSLGAVWFFIRAALALRAPGGGSDARR